VHFSLKKPEVSRAKKYFIHALQLGALLCLGLGLHLNEPVLLFVCHCLAGFIGGAGTDE
jgi:hypothetical protein